MFKATHRHSNEDIIILDPHWSDRLDHLRQLDRQDDLLCPGCQQPVRVKAGQKKRWHFAHKHLQACPLSHEAAIVLEARAILYQWLVSKFKEGAVTLEKKLESHPLPRPIDCWVQTRSGQAAYWIIAAQMKPDQRAILKQIFELEVASVSWLFLSTMLREEKEAGTLHLTTTEREFMQESPYDEVIDPYGHLLTGPSLHYLDPTQEQLTTFRTLSLRHPPQMYRGRKQAHPMSVVLAHPKTGEFVHPGEYEYWRDTKQARERIKKEREEQEKKDRERLIKYNRTSGSVEKTPVSGRAGAVISEETFDNQAATCILCGRTKIEWGFITETGKRICHDCYAGKS